MPAEKCWRATRFQRSGDDSALLADFTKKVTALKDIDQAKRDSLIADAKKALLTSFQPAYQKLIAYLEAQEKTATDDVGAWRFLMANNSTNTRCVGRRRQT